MSKRDSIDSICKAAVDYEQATEYMKRATLGLRDVDLRCANPVRVEPSGRVAACRKGEWGGMDPLGNPTDWVYTRPHAEWCAGCLRVQELTDERKRWRMVRGRALQRLNMATKAAIKKGVLDAKENK